MKLMHKLLMITLRTEMKVWSVNYRSFRYILNASVHRRLHMLLFSAQMLTDK